VIEFPGEVASPEVSSDARTSGGWPVVEDIVAVGRVLSGRYQIEEWLGGGGMAEVWRGRDLRLDRSVAIKLLAGPWLQDPTAAERFDREARTAAGLTHPNIVAVHDVGLDDNSRYLVMELIEGVTVATMLADGPLPVSQAVAIAAQTCDGLAAAHATGIIHRDIKPANLMLTPAGIVKICDFGIAHALLGTADFGLADIGSADIGSADFGSAVFGLAEPASAMGTSNYIAPEQARGEHVDARADLYALGCTMYAMLTGAAPFSGDESEVLHLHLTQPPLPLREHRADIPPPLEALVAQLLAKTADARPASAVEVRIRLMALPQDPTTAVIPMSSEALVGASKATVPASFRPPRTVVPLVRALVGLAEPATVTLPSRPPAGRNWRLAAAVAVAVVAIVLAAFLVSRLATSRSVPGTAVGSSATSVAGIATPAVPSVTAGPQSPVVTQSPTFIEPSRSPQPVGAVQPSSQAPPVDPIVAIRLSIRQQVDTGTLNPDKDTDLYKKVDEIARAMNEGDSGEAAKKVKELRDKLANLLEAGQLTPGGYDTLIQGVDRIAAALP